MSVEALLGQVNAAGARRSEKRITAEDLPRLMAQIGVEVDGLADTRQYLCQPCGKIFDRTEAQGPPLQCGQCGADFRERPDALADRGPNQVIRLDMLAVRPDIFDPGGMARCLRGYLGVQTGPSDYPAGEPRISVKVDPRLSEESSRRPFIACAVLRGVKLDHERIKMLMNLQEDLHWALGRDRKLASIGAYDLDTLGGETFHYDAIAPGDVRFVPLGFSPDRPENSLTPAEILEKHGTGRAYAHLLKGLKRYPLLRDGAGTVLSMPPIINSESTRVTMNSRNLFIDVTGLSQRSVDRALNIMVVNLKELIPEAAIEQVVIDAPDGRRRTPDLSPRPMRLSLREAADTIGVELDAERLSHLLERMGHRVEDRSSADRSPTGLQRSRDQEIERARPAPSAPLDLSISRSLDLSILTVLTPAWRNDIMHPVDLIEDAAIAYGYDNLVPSLVPTFTVGAPRAIEERSAIARRALAGLGFHQVMTLVLTSAEAAFDKWRLPADERAVLIDNPISTEQTMCRVSLLPGALETLAINKQHELPQQIFEVGDVCLLDPDAETGASEQRRAAAVMIGTHVGYADIRAVADAFMHELGMECRIEPTEHNSFIPGRVAAIVDPAGARLGVMGEVHPEVLENYGLKHAVAAMEIVITASAASE